MNRRILATVPLAATIALAGCATTDPGADAGLVHIVASTNVYGDLAAGVGGDRVEVESIITSLAQDPHAYEASARDQLTISRADLIIANGGGYDAFIDQLVDASATDAAVVNAVAGDHGHDHDHEGDHDHDHADGVNEHVWYDPHAMIHVVEEIAARLTTLDPDGAQAYADNAAALIGELEGLEAALADIATEHAGAEVFVTEPVPVHLIAAAGLVDVTPAAFSRAVEAGQDVPAATMLEAIRVLEGGDVRVLIANAQTGGAETTQAAETAAGAGIPVLEFTELVPEGETYVTWMRGNIDALAGTLTR